MERIYKRKAYSEEMLSTFNEMRKSKIMCDFTVKVDDKAFLVHSVVLAAASKYFAAMFSSEMKEARERSVNMATLSALSVRQCIEYMYTGEAGLKTDSVENILEASHMMQLRGLTSICFHFMKETLSVENCLSALNISNLYGVKKFKMIAEKYILENFEAVTLTEQFLSITRSELLHYIEASNASYRVSWQAVVRWFSVARKKAEKILANVMQSIKSEFPFQFLLETAWNEPLIKEDNPCNKFVIDSLFKDVEAMKSNLSIENFFVVKSLAKSLKLSNFEEVNEALTDYLEEKFEELVERDEFKHLEEHELVFLFKSAKTKCSSEKTKWTAALKWTKHDQPSREGVFEKLFQSINLELLPPEFLQNTVRNETLVTESHNCKDMLLDVVFARSKKESPKNFRKQFSYIGSDINNAISTAAATKTANQNLSKADYTPWYKIVGMPRVASFCDERKSKTDQQAFVTHIACLNVETGDIKALNLLTNEWKDLPTVNLIGFYQQKKIISVENEIYCLNYKRIFFLDQSRMKWIQRQAREKQMSRYFEVVVIKKCVYVLDCDDMICYDTVDDTWEENLPGSGLDGSSCAAASDKFIYAMGGIKDGKPQATAKLFDPSLQSWSRLARMNIGRNGASATVFQEKVFVVGGANWKTFLNSAETYDPVAETWTYVRRMSVRRMWPHACVASDRLYVVGGARDAEGKFLESNSVESFDDEANEWNIVKEFDWRSGYIPCCVVNLD